MLELVQMLEKSNLIRYLPTVILPAIGDTLEMVLVSAVLSICLGMMFGIVLVITADNGLSPHPFSIIYWARLRILSVPFQ